MSTPLQSFLGGVGLVIPVQILLTFNGQPFGISGFLRNATRGRKDALASVAGMLVAGLVVGGIERVGPEFIAVQLPRIAISGLLVGVGTSVSDPYYTVSCADSIKVIKRLHIRVCSIISVYHFIKSLAAT